MPRSLTTRPLPFAALLLAGLAMTTGACSRNADTHASGGDRPAAESGAQDWSALRGFSRIDATGPDDVTVTIGDSFSVRAEGDPRSIARLDIRVKGDRLVIGRQSSSLWKRVDDGKGAIIRVTLPAVAGVALTGSGNVTLDRAEGAALDLSLTGSGNMDIGQVKLATLKAEITGSGGITLAGAADQGELSVTGSGNIDSPRLALGSGAVSLLGSGNAAFASDGPVAIKIMGSGDVTVKGRAQCKISQFGSGQARCAP